MSILEIHIREFLKTIYVLIIVEFILLAYGCRLIQSSQKHYVMWFFFCFLMIFSKSLCMVFHNSVARILRSLMESIVNLWQLKIRAIFSKKIDYKIFSRVTKLIDIIHVYYMKKNLVYLGILNY